MVIFHSYVSLPHVNIVPSRRGGVGSFQTWRHDFFPGDSCRIGSECPWALFPDAYGSHGSAFYIGKELGILVALAVASGFSHTGVGHVSLTLHFCWTEIQPPQLWFVVSTNSTFASIPQKEMNIPNLHTVLRGS